ncbi:hypothetical protein KYI92_05615 [Pantoea allii]|uniref:Uncharacterized protein n=1 Tax=Pantoea allii TaxID=574096 RepID=A0ABS6VBK0_9GAMM|nr:hypothetical protein [Pantoea allii]MBW1212997.1 hypothetical protein [Pantoea allii]MBW1256685.1 hypothetical protein [Pantoea allii]MBW1265669.1 hypothetical protein [Pantoea allii]MBW1287879.1 hypothetical protein [Pantoea allii]
MGIKVSTKKALPKLETTFFIVSDDSKIRVKLGALNFNYILSPCEKYLYVQLCNSKTEDAGKFIKIDTATGEKIYSVFPEWGWASGYAFTDQGALIVESGHYGSWQIDDGGNIVDRAGYYLHRVNIADYGTMSALPDFFELHGKTPETCALAMASLERFLSSCFSMFHGVSYGASALKARAEIQVFMGDSEDALQSCVDALYLNPKATVKRMLNTLSKKLSIDKERLKQSEWAEQLKLSVEKIRNKEIESGEDSHRKVIPTTNVTLTKKINVMNAFFGKKTKIMLLVLIAILIFIFVVLK